MTPYLIASLPRSRTAWLANVLTWEKSFCFHEMLKECASPDQLIHRMINGSPIDGKYVGDADPMIPMFWEKVIKTMPDAKVLFVVRDPEQSFHAMEKALNESNVAVVPAVLQHFVLSSARSIEQFFKFLPEEQRLSVSFDSLNSIDVVKRLWSFLLPDIEFPFGRVRRLMNMKVTSMLDRETKILKRENIESLAESLN